MSERAIVEVALFTDDVKGVTRFYRDVTGSAPETEWPGGAIFAVAGTKILIHQRSSPVEGGPPTEDHVALAVADLPASCAELRELGLTFLVEPQDFPWGRSAYLRDPDGRLIELSQG